MHLSDLKEKYANTPKPNPRTGAPAKGTYKRRGPGNYETVVKEVKPPNFSNTFFWIRKLTFIQVMEYLTSSPSPLEKPVYDSTTFKTLLTKLRPYELTKAEILMILNLRPLNQCTLNMIVEEMYDRHTDEQSQEMLDIIAEVLGTPEPDADAMET